MVEMKAEVVEHYGQGDLKERLSRALYAAGLSSQVLSPMVLAPLDQFHVRGNRCNEGARGSGAGRPRRDGSGRWSGLGGPSRYLAATYGCHVTGIDLNSSFVEAARYRPSAQGLWTRWLMSAPRHSPFPTIMGASTWRGPSTSR